jgi:uncharacterized protein YgiM (DUF1202 family)
MKGGLMRNMLMLVLALVSASALAETGYVSDRLLAPLRWAQGEAAPLVKQLEAGTPVEVLERAGAFVRVKDKQGAEGWLEARQVSGEAPARAQLARANDELKQLRAQVAAADAELKKARAALAEESAKAKSLEAKAAASVEPPVVAASAPTVTGCLCYAWSWFRGRHTLAAGIHQAPLRRHVHQDLKR